MVINLNSVDDSLEFLHAYAINDKNSDYKIVLGVVFSKNKLATKKKLKAEENLLLELSKTPIFFPHQFGKSPTIALYTLKNISDISGIDRIGSDDMIKEIQNNVFVPNYLLCLKDEMPYLSKYSRSLGPKGLMPTPKQGTVVEEDTIKKVIDDLKRGSFKIKVNKQLMTQIPVGMVNMGKKALDENIMYLIRFINEHLPSSYLKSNLKNMYLTSTQGPSINITI